jgi:cobaltochelatase CobT
MTWRDWVPILVLALLLVTLVGWRPRRRDSVVPIEDVPAVEIEWRPEVSVFDDPGKFGYHIFTTSHDRTVEVADLPVQPGAAKRKRMLSKVIRRHTETTNRFAELLREHGAGKELLVSILIDHSGSMNRKAGTGPDHSSRRGTIVTADSGAALAAGIAISTAIALEKCGARTEVLGFTTSEWRGGKSRVEWIHAARPARPGRLNDLLHLIYKHADEASDHRWMDLLETLLYPPCLKENIDGEAIAWARSRLLAQQATNRLLIVISDGAPVDDSTLVENGPSYLERHLLHVIEDIEHRGDLKIMGIGIGYDMSRYMSRSIAVGGTNPSFDSQVFAIADLIAERAPTQ